MSTELKKALNTIAALPTTQITGRVTAASVACETLDDIAELVGLDRNAPAYQKSGDELIRRVRDAVEDTKRLDWWFRSCNAPREIIDAARKEQA